MAALRIAKRWRGDIVEDKQRAAIISCARMKHRDNQSSPSRHLSQNHRRRLISGGGANIVADRAGVAVWRRVAHGISEKAKALMKAAVKRAATAI